MSKIIIPLRPVNSESGYTDNIDFHRPQKFQKISDDVKTLDKKRNKKVEPKVTTASLVGSALFTFAYLFMLAKSIKKGNFKATDMFKIPFDSIPRSVGLATSAMLGGLTGGLLVDEKKHRKPKLKEAVHQFFGNILTPITIVGMATSAINKRNDSELKNTLYGGIVAILGVAGGVTFGNKAASYINEKIFHEEDKRKVGVKDFGIHVDDLLTVMGMSKLGKVVQKIVSLALPPVFMICGYEAGTRKSAD